MDRHLIRGTASIVEALESLNRLSGETMTLFAVDEDNSLIGSLTDGDIRRALLAGSVLSDPVEGICRRDCLRLEDDLAVIPLARSKGIALLPRVSEGRVVSLIDLKRQRGLVPADAVLMAGGAGERLRPLTESVPKPLLPVGGRAVIDYNVELLRAFGIDNIYLAVNYLKEQLIDHFAGDEGIVMVEEPHKLGTIGALRLIGRNGIPAFSHDNVLVMNADLLTDIDLEAMYLRHMETAAWLTIAAVPYSVSVPYAILAHEGERITGLLEKPTYNYYANAGIYLLRRQAAELVPEGEGMDATDLADRLIRSGKRVTLFPFDGRWIDIGSPDDYRHACELTSGVSVQKLF